MIKEQTERDDADFMRGLMIERSEASFPHEFRKNTGQVIELNFVAGRTLQLLHETLSVARVLHVGIDALGANPVLAESLRKEVQQTSSGGELLSNNLHPLYSIVIVNLCAALEAGIDDTLLVAIRFRPGLIGRLVKLGVTKLAASVDRDLTYAEARQTLTRLKAFTKSETTAPNGWLRRLEAVGLPVTLIDEHSRALREVIYVRNCIVHRARRADDRCASDMSILTAQAGSEIRVTQSAMAAYAGTCLEIAGLIAHVAQQSYAAD
jgi:hypothetical protein